MKTRLVVLVSFIPAGLLGQRDPVERLRQVLPAQTAEQVVATVQEARAQGLPADGVARLALEGVAKGRSGQETVTAARELVAQLAGARRALQDGGRAPAAPEIETGALALMLGVEGTAISALATSAPSGRTLAVPLFVMGALAGQGLPSTEALSVVLARLRARATDSELSAMPVEAGSLLARGMRPAEVGRALAAQRAGVTVPVGWSGLPPGPPSWVPANGGRAGKRPDVPRQPAGRGRP